MPVTTRMAQRRLASQLLLALPDELLCLLLQHLLQWDMVPEVLRTGQACKALHVRLQPVLHQATTRRLNFIDVVEEWRHVLLRAAYTVIDEGRQVVKLPQRCCPWDRWAVGQQPLPTTGISKWQVRVVKVHDNNHMVIGVCDAMLQNAWGIALFNGRLVHCVRPVIDGRYAVKERREAGGGQLIPTEQEGTPIMRPTVAQHLQGKGGGTTIEVIIDHDAGTLSFRVNASRLLPARVSLEKNASLLPWVSIYFARDCVGFVSRYVHTG